MQTSGNLVIGFAELAAGMKDSQYDLKGRTALLVIDASRNASAIILNPDGIILVYGHLDIIAEATHCLIDTVVHNLVDQMMKTSLPYISNVHRRSFPHGLKAFQYLNTIRGILLFRLFHLFVIYHILSLYNKYQIYEIIYKFKQIPAVK